MDTLQLFAAARCLQEDFAHQTLRGIGVEQGKATLHFACGRLFLVAQSAPLGLFWDEAVRTVPKPAGPAAILGQKLAGFRLLAIEVPWADRILRLRFAHAGLDRQEQRWSLIAECFGGRGALLLVDENRHIHWSSRWDSLDQDEPRILPQALYRPPSSSASWATLENPLSLVQVKRRTMLGVDAEAKVHSVLQGPPGAQWWQLPEAEPYPITDNPAAIAITALEATRWREVRNDKAAPEKNPEDLARRQEGQRLRRRLQRLQEDLARWQTTPASDRRHAAALFAAPDRLHHGGPVRVLEYRAEGIAEIEIEIPAGKTLHAYAEELIKRSQRAQRARQRIAEEIARVELALLQLPQRELVPTEAMMPVKKASKQGAQPGIDQRVVDGFTILWGKNARANDYLSFRLGQPQDIWLHVQDLQGSHVLIRRQNAQQPVPPQVLRSAAEIALQHSNSQALSAEVDWTELRHVSRHPQGGAGRVVYRQFQTLRVRRPGSARN
ncbi:NFACT RNA binding domain-containing protein [Acidithiobacillus sp. IBUN Pt1247-S3]|uniref:NFACT RNA binding domain-containing protein n=1 Tax=Acidithiobacillus sp. IBUN Pt1247-S3 TaxID=3166642 RepID=UPI0034E4B350